MLSYVHDSMKLWRLWDPIQKNVINATDVVFDENNNSASKGLAQLVGMIPLTAKITTNKKGETIGLNAIEETLAEDASDEGNMEDTIVVQPLPSRHRAALVAYTPDQLI